MVTLSLTKNLKPSGGKKTAHSTNSAGSMGSYHVDECKLIHLIFLYKAQVQVDQGPPHKTRHTKTNRKNVWKILEHMGTGGNFLNKAPIAYALKSRIDKWKLRTFQGICKEKDIVNNIKQQPTVWEKTFTNRISNTVLL